MTNIKFQKNALVTLPKECTRHLKIIIYFSNLETRDVNIKLGQIGPKNTVESAGLGWNRLVWAGMDWNELECAGKVNDGLK